MSTLPEDLAPAVPEVTRPLPAAHPEIEPTGAQPERHLRAVPPRRRRQPRFALWIGTIVTATTLFLLVAFNVLMVQGQFELDRIEEQRALEQKEYARLRDEVAKLGAPEAIVGKARAAGMVDPSNVTFLHAPTAGAAAPPRDDTATTQKDTRLGTRIAASP